MSTVDQPNENFGNDRANNLRIDDLLDLIDQVFQRHQDDDIAIRQILRLLHEHSLSKAAILWRADDDMYRWEDSVGVSIEDTDHDSNFTGDIVSNVDAAFHAGSADIFVCSTEIAEDLQEHDDLEDPLICDFVLNHRQIVLAIDDNNGTCAVFVLFQPHSVEDGREWTLGDVLAIQHRVNSWLKNTPTETEGPAENSRSEFATEADALPENDSLLHEVSSSENEDLRTMKSPESEESIADEWQSKKGLRLSLVPMLSSDDEDAYFSARQQLTAHQRAMRVARVVGRSLHETECSYDVANELHSYFAEGRVSLAIFRGSSCRVRAVSNQQVFDRRSSLIAAIETLATKCALIRHPIWHPEDDDTLPSDVSCMFEKYYEASDSQSIALLPLIRKQDPSTDPNDLKAVVRDRDASAGEVVGVVVIEGMRLPLSKQDIEDQWEAVEIPIVNAVANSRKHNSLFLMPVWKELGHVTDLFRGHHRNKAIATVLALFAVISALVAVPGDFKLRSEGVVQPMNRSKVYAETSGIVSELLVKDGQWVEKNETLITLANPQLYAEIARVEGALRETSEKLRTAKLQRMRGDFQNAEERKSGVLESAGFAATLEKMQEQYELLLEKKSQLEIKSPVAGQVVTWDMRRRLLARPVEPGQKLLTIADPKGPWELELKLPDKRSGYLRDVWQDSTTGQDDAQKKPTASYVLASHPTEINKGVVREVARSADVDEDEGNIIRVYVDLNEHPGKSGQHVRPGTEVIAHIHAGRASIGYCKLFEFFDWVRRIWFKYA